MTSISTTFIIGFSIFIVCTACTGIAFFYFLFKGKYLKNTLYNDRKLYEIKWIRSIWIYFSLFTSFLLFSLLYMDNYLGEGLALTPIPTIILWERWLIIALIIFIFTFTAYEMYRRHSDIQSFYIILYMVISILLLYRATLSIINGSKILWIISSIIFALGSLIFYFIPENKIKNPYTDHTTTNDSLSNYLPQKQSHSQQQQQQQEQDRGNMFYPQNHGYRETIDKESTREAMNYRIVYFVFIFLSYFVYFLIWLLSSSNGLIFAIDLNSEVIVYLVADCLLLIPFSIGLIWYSIKNPQVIKIKNTQTNQVSFKSRPMNNKY